MSIQPTAVKTPIWDSSLQRGHALLQEFPETAAQIELFYGLILQSKRRLAQRYSKHGAPVEDVAATIFKALTARTKNALHCWS